MKLALIVLIVFALVFGVVAFEHCYSEHRERDFSFWTAVISCSGS